MKNSLLKLRERLDMGSMAIIFITFTLFVVSLFQKGLTHEILVDTGIFWYPLNSLSCRLEITFM